jgi:hypothetical protein
MTRKHALSPSTWVAAMPSVVREVTLDQPPYMAANLLSKGAIFCAMPACFHRDRISGTHNGLAADIAPCLLCARME